MRRGPGTQTPFDAATRKLLFQLVLNIRRIYAMHHPVRDMPLLTPFFSAGQAHGLPTLGQAHVGTPDHRVRSDGRQSLHRAPNRLEYLEIRQHHPRTHHDVEAARRVLQDGAS